MKNINQIHKNECCGCNNCLNVCPVNAIKTKLNDKGFLEPIVDSSICINCGRCLKVCVAVNITDTYNKKSDENASGYICYSRNPLIRETCSSGGIITEICQSFLKEKNTYVCGVLFDENFKVKHKLTDDKEELNSFKGSKYIQSNINSVVKKIKELLINEKKVLFIGTPCQVSAIRKYIELYNVNDNNLYCIDLFCHGVSNQYIFDEYIRSKITQDKYKLCKYNFRGLNGYREYYKIKRSNSYKQKVVPWQLSKYMYAFMYNFILRDCCYSCKYVHKKRIGDISSGDFWHKGQSNDVGDKGISAIIVSTEKGKRLFNEIENKIFKEKISLDKIVDGNQSLKYPASKPKNFNNFWKLNSISGINAALNKYAKPKYITRIKIKIEFLMSKLK